MTTIRLVRFAAIAAGALVVAMWFMLLASMGDCALNTSCIFETTRRMTFIGGPAVGLFTIVLAWRWLSRGKT